MLRKLSFQNIDSLKIREGAFLSVLRVSGITILLIVIGIFITLTVSSIPSIRAIGLKFLTNSTWDPVSGNLGALPFIGGTLLTSFLALLISLPFSLAIGLFLGEYFQKGPIASIFSNAIGLLAGIPSVIYGFWALFVLVPVVRSFETSVGATPYGVGILSASLVLSIMIIPYSASLARDVIGMAPRDLKEGAYALGATRFEVVARIIIPYAKSGIFAGLLLALGRALGETMAVTMVIGNTHDFPTSIFSPANTMASVIANEFTEATGEVYRSSLIELGLVLFILTTIINVIGKSVIARLSRR